MQGQGDESETQMVYFSRMHEDGGWGSAGKITSDIYPPVAAGLSCESIRLQP